MFIRATVCIVVSSLGLGLIGCNGDSGPKMAGVTGTVTFGGKPIAGATVTMHTDGVKAAPSLGFTDASGKFKMTTGGRPGVPVGNAKVAISKAAVATGAPDMKDMKPEDMMKMQQEAGGTTKKTEPPKPEIPLKYADATKSGLTATIDASESKNAFEFNLVE